MQYKSFIKNISGAIATRLHLNNAKKHPYQLSWLQAKIHKHVDNLSEKTIGINDLSITYKHKHSLFHTYPEIFIREIYKFQSKSEQPLIIDCGANIGLSVLYFKKYFPESKVIAFEPDSRNFALLEKNIQQNHFAQNNTELIQKAVWMHNDGITFNADGTEGSKIIEGTQQDTVLVETTRLAGLLQQYEQIDFLKMDIEGAEYTVLNDCAAYLGRIQNLFVEYHGLVSETNKLNQLLHLFEKNGFCVYMTTASDPITKPFYDKKSKNDFDVQLNIFCFKS